MATQDDARLTDREALYRASNRARTGDFEVTNDLRHALEGLLYALATTSSGPQIVRMRARVLADQILSREG